MSISNYLEDILLDHITSTYTSIHVQLHTGDPGDDGTLNQSYETTRKDVTFGAASGGVMTSTDTQEWSNWPSGGAGEAITHFSLWDASTAGNCLGAGTMNTTRTLAHNDTFRINAIQWSLD